MATINSLSSLETAVQQALNQFVQRELELEIEEAKVRLERAIRASSAGIAASALSFYSMERMGSELIIKVKIDTSST